ncbi:hypothetical protein NKR23_g11626 [Pleurostoma richardsiae]|uniref:PNPLA domain-containing protein n=1 Tax=Pleurostoma richardsiae TaxID=41990 RepID=A0AA38R3A2_9PEZI|nr:hypothetical protein NKR23_g11626 [Pleurostoma richardsiae]
MATTFDAGKRETDTERYATVNGNIEPQGYGVLANINLLSINEYGQDSGGGVRNLIQLYQLDILMKVLGKRHGGRSDLKPCQYFHIIAGTGAGGIIAIMLGRLRMSIKEAVTAYKALGEAVYAEESVSSYSGSGPLFDS